jgi:TolB-like protein/lipopolysaccharide biosynthesis regulator YciM
MFLRIGYADKDETPSIAILPFENKGADEDEFYAYGISSDLIADVTSAGLIRVASLKDIEKLDYNNLENDELAKKLLVRYVAQGTLWKVDTLFQLSLEIFDTKLSKVIYTKRWETAWKDLAVIKDDLSDNILETLEIEVLQDIELARKINPDAYEYYLKGKYKYEKRKTLEDKNIAVQLLEQAVELDENFLGAKLIFASIAKHEGDSEKAIEITLNVLDQAEKINDSKIIKKCLNNLGFYYNNSRQYEKAEPYLLRLIEIAEELNDNYWLGWGYGNLSVTVLYGSNNNIQEIERAEEYNAKAFSLLKNSDSKRRVAPNREFRGYIYRYKGDYDMALNYYHQSHEMFLELDNTTRIWSNLLQLGKTYNLKGDYNKALDYFGRSLKIAEKLEEKPWIAWTLNNLGKIYFLQGEYEKSVKYLERSTKIMQEQKKDDYEQDLDVMCYLYLSYKALGKQYDESVIRSLIKEEEKEDFDYQFNFALYQILEDSFYLDAAYKIIKEITAWMDDEMKEKFLNYPIPKQIIQEWEGVS